MNRFLLLSAVMLFAAGAAMLALVAPGLASVI